MTEEGLGQRTQTQEMNSGDEGIPDVPNVTSPVRTECGMFVMYCMQCCMSVSAVL